MKRTNFSRRFDKPDLNFQKNFTQPKLRSYSEIITHVRTGLSYIFTARFYASAVLAMGLCLCLCLSVCHKSEFY